MTSTAIGDAAAGTSRPAPSARTGGTWRRVLGHRVPTVAAVLAAMVVIGALALYRTIMAEPLRVHGFSAWRSEPGDVAGISSIRNHFGEEIFIEHEPGGVFVVQMGLVNDSRRDVQIRGFPRGSWYYYELENVEIPAPAERFGEYVEFRPFTLAAGDTQWIRARYRFVDCILQGGSELRMWRSGITVEYRVFGFNRTGHIESDRDVIAVPGGACADDLPD